MVPTVRPALRGSPVPPDQPDPMVLPVLPDRTVHPDLPGQQVPLDRAADLRGLLDPMGLLAILVDLRDPLDLLASMAALVLSDLLDLLDQPVHRERTERPVPTDPMDLPALRGLLDPLARPDRLAQTDPLDP